MKEIAKGMGLPTKAAGDELRQLIEAVKNQVIIEEKTSQEKGKAYWCLYLADDSGVLNMLMKSMNRANIMIEPEPPESSSPATTAESCRETEYEAVVQERERERVS